MTCLCAAYVQFELQMVFDCRSACAFQGEAHYKSTTYGYQKRKSYIWLMCKLSKTQASEEKLI